MKRIMLAGIAVLSLTPAPVIAGSANVKLSCTSDSGRTKLSGNVPGDLPDGFSLVFKIDNKRLDYYRIFNDYDGKLKRANAKIAVNDKIRNRKYQFVVTNKDGTALLSLKAIGTTIKYKDGASGETNARFRATVIGVDPRNTSRQSRRIRINCRYHYSV